MDVTSIIDIQYAIVALAEVRCGPAKYIEGNLVSRRTYRSKLAAIQRELRHIIRLLNILSNDDGHHMVAYPKWKDLAVPKCVAARAKSSVNALDNAVDHLEKDISRGPSGTSLKTRSILEGARIWNDTLLDTLDDVTPRDGDMSSLNRSNLLIFYDTMWYLESELAEVGTNLAIISGGMTVGASKVLLGAVINSPANPTLECPPSGERHNARTSPPQSKPTRHHPAVSVHSHLRGRAHAHAPVNDGRIERYQATIEDDPSVSPLTKPNGQKDLHQAKDSLDLKYRFPSKFNPKTREPGTVKSRIPVARAGPDDKAPPRYTQAPRPHQVPLPVKLDEDPEHPRDHPEVGWATCNTPVHKVRRDATAGLPHVERQVNHKTRSGARYVPRHDREHTQHAASRNAPKLNNRVHGRHVGDELLDDSESAHKSIFTIDTSIQREIDNFRVRKRATAAARAAVNSNLKVSRPHSPRPSSSVSQQPKRATPLSMDPRKLRRTLPELVIERHSKISRIPEYDGPSPPVEEPMRLGRATYQKPLAEDGKKEFSPTTTTLEALKAMDQLKDEERAVKKRAAIAKWSEKV